MNPGSVARRQFSKLLPGVEGVVRKHLEGQGVTSDEAEEWAGHLCACLVQDPGAREVASAWSSLSPAIQAAIQALVKVGGETE